MLPVYLVSQGFGRKDLNCSTMFGDIKQEFAVVRIGEFKNISARLIK